MTKENNKSEGWFEKRESGTLSFGGHKGSRGKGTERERVRERETPGPGGKREELVEGRRKGVDVSRSKKSRKEKGDAVEQRRVSGLIK